MKLLPLLYTSITLLFIGLGTTPKVYAESNDGIQRLHHEFGLFTGPYLISNAKTILPASGARLSWAFQRSHIELQAMGANADGTSYYIGEVNWRKQFEYQSLAGLFLFGFDWHYVRSQFSTEYALSQGWHVGTGLNIKINDYLYFRNDYMLKFGVNRALLATLGLSFSFGGASSK